MSQFLYHPVRNPINPANPFGTPSPRYTNLGQIGHPGEDYQAPTGTKLYAPCDGDAFYAFDQFHGDGIYIRHTDTDGQNYNIILWHMFPRGSSGFPFKIATDGSITKVKAGDFLGYTDNSGFPVESNGAHLHAGLMPTDKYWAALHPQNGFMGCISPAHFWNNLFAEDIPALDKAVEASDKLVEIVASNPLPIPQKISLLKVVADFLKSLLQ